MTTISAPKRTHGYGLVLRRRQGDCVVIDGPARVHFLQGQCECLIVHQGEVDQVTIADQCLSLPGPAMLYWMRGAGRIGISAVQTVRALRGELLGGIFAEDPLVAALANTAMQPSADGPLAVSTTRKSLSHVIRTDEGLSWRP